MKIVQGREIRQHKTEKLLGVVTDVYPFLHPNQDHTKPMDWPDDEDRLPGCFSVDESTGTIEVNFDHEWMYDGSDWPVETAAAFAEGMLEAVKIGRAAQAKTTTR